MIDLLERFNPWWSKDFKFPGIRRKKYLSTLMMIKDLKDVILISGLRRTGKTTLMYQMVHELIRTGIDPSRILYVSLDNIGFSEKNILDIESEYRSHIGIPYDERVFLFLDEIHFKKRFELQLKNIYDMGMTKIFASGSANLEILMRTPYLTGRYRTVNVRPLDLKEFIEFSGQAGLDPVEIAEDHALTGGIPDYVITRDINSLNTMLQSILFRDIFIRSGLRDKETLENIFILIARNVSTPLSVRRISRLLGHSEETVRSVIGLMEEAGLIHKVEKYGKFKERKANPPKIYLADTGLFNLLHDRMNIGTIIENAVCLRLKEFGKMHYHHSHGKEIDFILNGNAFEVKYCDFQQDGSTEFDQSLSWKGKKRIVSRSFDGSVKGMKAIPFHRVLLSESENDLF